MKNIKEQQESMKQIAYWKDSYFISDDNAAEQGEILDSVNAFGSEHKLLDVPIDADQETMQSMVNEALNSTA